MSAPDVSAAMARVLAINGCLSVVLDTIDTAMNEERDARGMSEVWRRSRPIVHALNDHGKVAWQAYLRAKQEAGL